MKVLVTGGTGALGRVVVERLLAGGHDVTVASRRARAADAVGPPGWTTVDWRTGAGLDTALAGVDTVVHCAHSYRGIDLEQRLVDAARRAGEPHVVYVSIVGVERIPFFYYRAKLAAERLLAASGLPWSVLRATQFHDLVREMLALALRAPVLPVLDVCVQPVDVTDVAARLAELATGEPAGYAGELGGPEVRRMRELARTYLRSTGHSRPLVPVRLPGRTFRAFRAGANLTPDRALGTVTFENYLRRHSEPATTSYRGVR
ncbi:MAG TPA: NAD(P)H-binding protein [Streptosporangiales bacterium]